MRAKRNLWMTTVEYKSDGEELVFKEKEDKKKKEIKKKMNMNIKKNSR